jgi:hypothetical protein
MTKPKRFEFFEDFEEAMAAVAARKLALEAHSALDVSETSLNEAEDAFSDEESEAHWFALEEVNEAFLEAKANSRAATDQALTATQHAFDTARRAFGAKDDFISELDDFIKTKARS